MHAKSFFNDVTKLAFVYKAPNVLLGNEGMVALVKWQITGIPISLRVFSIAS